MRRATKKVIDANYLQDDRLAQWLSQSNNYSVLTDYGAMEAYKGDTLFSIYKSMTILSRYPDQVLVLKSTQIACRLKSDRPGLQRRLVDRAQTNGFKKYCSDLQKAKEGDASLKDALLSLGKEANAHMAQTLRYAETVKNAIGEFRLAYSSEELGVLRTCQALTNSIAKKFFDHVLSMTAMLFAKLPQVQSIPTARKLPNSFIFRYVLCSYLNVLNWISDGGAKGAKPETIRNDMVDMNYATFATYFDGFLSNDEKAIRVYQQAKYLLEHLFCAEPVGAANSAKQRPRT
jgi:hypothetical protein